jgi:hypothetical protein
MKNRLTDLNDILFAQLERLTSEDLPADQMEAEVARTQSVVQLADRIVDTARLQLDGVKFLHTNGGADVRRALPASLGIAPPTGAKS